MQAIDGFGFVAIGSYNAVAAGNGAAVSTKEAGDTGSGWVAFRSRFPDVSGRIEVLRLPVTHPPPKDRIQERQDPRRPITPVVHPDRPWPASN